MLAQSDPTDHALATIASILDHSEPPPREVEKSAREKSSTEKSPTLVPADIDGYTKIGPGPIAPLRFKWTVRRAGNDDYFVDEMIGENSVPKISGPMAKEAAVKLVDDREAEARQRFEQLRSEMTGRAGLDLARSGGEA